MYPVSIPFDGAAVNFTLVSNYENLDFGIVACRRSVPQVQRMIDYLEESLAELEDAAGLRRRGRTRGPLQRLNATAPAAGKASGKQTSPARKNPSRVVPRLHAKAGGDSRAQPKRAAATQAAPAKAARKAAPKKAAAKQVASKKTPGRAAKK